MILLLSHGQDVNAPHSAVDYFTRPKPETLDLFLRFHPQQKSDKPVVQRAFFRKDGTNRKWLSCTENRQALFCFLCMAYAKPRESSSFISGTTTFTHTHLRVDEYEQSDNHGDCAEAYFLRSSEKIIKDLLMGPQMSLHRQQVRRRRQMLECIIDVMKLIGKRSLSH